MIKLSEMLKSKNKMDIEEFKLKISKPYIKEIMLECVEDLAEEENIEDCEVRFNYNILRRDLSLDEVIDIISGEVSQKIFQCVNEIIDFDEIKEYDEDLELEESLEK